MKGPEISGVRVKRALPGEAWGFVLSAALMWGAILLAQDSGSPLEFTSRTIENSMVDGELLSILSGDVVFYYEDYVIKSEFARYWRTQQKVELATNVEVTKKGQRLRCQRALFLRKEGLVTATGNVRFTDDELEITVTGNRFKYDLKKDQAFLEDSPRIVRFDASDAETLYVRGRHMHYDDSLKKATITDSVKIEKGELVSSSEVGYYLSRENILKLRKDPVITYGNQRLKGDSVNLYFRDDTLDAAMIVGNAFGLYIENGTSDTTRTRVWGDSMYMTVNDSGTLDSIWVYRNVESTYAPLRDTIRENKVTGHTMVLDFDNRRSVSSAEVFGNATSVYYLGEDEGAGRNEASGDTLSVEFRDGKAVRLRIAGGVRGTYFPN